MLLRRSLIAMALLSLACATITTGNAQTVTAKKTGGAPGTAKIWIESTTHDFGSVDAGTPLRYSFKIRNEGSVDLEIRSVVPSCGCTTSDYDKVLTPGSEGKITLAVEHTVGYSGETQKFATVTTNDPSQATFRLTLHVFFKGTAKPPNLGAPTLTPTGAKKVGSFLVSPGDKYTTAVVRGDSVASTLQIVNQSDKLAHITDVKVGGTSFKAVLRTIQDGKSYAISLTTNPQLKAGHYTQTLSLVTDDKDAPEIPISLDVTVYPLLVAAPTAIHMREVSIEGDVSKIPIPPIYVQKVRGEGVVIKSVTSDLPFLEIVPTTESEGRRIALHLKFDPAKVSGAGSFKGKVHIETNDQEVPSLDVTIDGTFY